MGSADLEQALRQARRVTVFTGAGVSAESGVPTFRDRLTGLWERHDPMQLATPDAFERDPSLVWGWYEWRRQIVREARPNAAHEAIAALERRVPLFHLITQNVDDLHERAGSTAVIHLHGRLMHSRCQRCGATQDSPGPAQPVAQGGARIPPPGCVSCGGRLRPDVVWFGESLPQAPWQAAVRASRDCDLFLCVGTSAVVQPAASLIDLARQSGATTVQVNPQPTAADDIVDHSLRGLAGEWMPRLVPMVGAATSTATPHSVAAGTARGDPPRR